MPKLFIRFLSPALRLDDGFDVGAEWLIVDDDGSARASGVADYRGLSELVDPGAGWVSNPDNVVVLIPSEHVLGVSCEVPGKNVAQMRKAAPYVVEEFIAGDIDRMHIGFGPMSRGTPVRCNLVDAELLEHWLTCCRDMLLEPGHVIAEADLLPEEKDTAYVLIDGDQVLLKAGGQAATVDRDNLEFALASLEESTLALVNGRLTDAERSELPTDVTISAPRAADQNKSALTLLADRWRARAPAINMLQGAFAPAASRAGVSGVWRTVAGLAALWFVVALASAVVQGWWASNRANVQEEQAQALYKDIYPGESLPRSSIRRTVAQRIGDASAADGVGINGFLGHLARTLSAGMRVLGMNYTAQRDELVLDLEIPSYQELESLKNAFAGNGLSVEISSADQTESGVRARLRLGGL